MSQREGQETVVFASPLEARGVTGMPVMTILRGRIIAEEGVVLAEPGTGRPVTSPTAGGPSPSRVRSCR